MCRSTNAAETVLCLQLSNQVSDVVVDPEFIFFSFILLCICLNLLIELIYRLMGQACRW